MSLHALIIGIDNYKVKCIRPLTGAVADAQAMKSYLTENLRTPEDHVVFLTDQGASREAIISALRRLATDPRINPGDPILIYYAGHGSQTDPPPAWKTGHPHERIQLTLPYDVFSKSKSKEVQPIAGRTLGLLLGNIAREKGGNIVVIMDSCHSASATRSTEHPSGSDRVRAAPIPSGFRLQDALNQDEDSAFSVSGSHVLLSACSATGQAWESNGRGVFTVALLDVLVKTPIAELSSKDIIKHLNIERSFRDKQRPHCEGVNQDRAIFSLALPLSPPPETFAVHRTRICQGPNASFEHVINGGTARGLVEGDELVVFPDDEASNSEGSLIVSKAFTYSSVMHVPVGLPLGGNPIARRPLGSRFRPVRVFSPSKEVIEALTSLKHSSPIAVVDCRHDAQAEILLRQDGRLEIRLLAPIIPVPYSPIQCTVDANELLQVLEQLWPFVVELDHTSDDPSLTQCVEVEIHELKDSRSRFPDSPATELSPCRKLPSDSDTVDLQHGVPYGLKIINNSKYDLYPEVQLLRVDDSFDIKRLYRCPFSLSNVDVPLPAGCTLPVGFGPGGSSPLSFPISSKYPLSFLKISLSTLPLDPHNDVASFRGARRLPQRYKGPWATVTKILISRPPASPSINAGPKAEVLEYEINRPSQSPIKPSHDRVVVSYPYGRPKGASIEQPAALFPRLRWPDWCRTWWVNLRKNFKTGAGGQFD